MKIPGNIGYTDHKDYHVFACLNPSLKIPNYIYCSFVINNEMYSVYDYFFYFSFFQFLLILIQNNKLMY
jgi:hypothetical protein